MLFIIWMCFDQKIFHMCEMSNKLSTILKTIFWILLWMTWCSIQKIKPTIMPIIIWMSNIHSIVQLSFKLYLFENVKQQQLQKNKYDCCLNMLNESMMLQLILIQLWFLTQKPFYFAWHLDMCYLSCKISFWMTLAALMLMWTILN